MMKKIIVNILAGIGCISVVLGQPSTINVNEFTDAKVGEIYSINNPNLTNSYERWTICNVNPVFIFEINKDVVESRAYSATISCSVTQTNKGNTGNTPYVFQKTISYDPDPSVTTVNRVVATLPEQYNNFGGELDITILTVDYKGIGISDLRPQNLKFSSRIDFDHHIDVQGAKAEFTSKLYRVSNGEIKAKWNPVYGAQFYQLEWYFVNDYEVSHGDKNWRELTFKEQDFLQNSTRVETNNLSYNIPALYEKGYILARVRGGNIDCDGNYLFSAWSFEFSTPSKYESVGSFSNDGRRHISGHNQALNWSQTTNFVEGGKKKTVVAYFDGNMKNRQNVTKLSSTNTTIVGETVYDKEGRPAVEVLPVPTTDQSYDYKPNFNKSAVDPTKAYSADDFDTYNKIKNGANGMSTNAGASKYYSSNSDFQNGYQKYVPDANGYPFVQKEFTRDNSGKVAKVHSYKTTDKDGDERMSKFYYMNPDAGELEKYFGNQVGDFSKYKKEYSVDANGQVVVSYLDGKDRVIVSALTGKNPEGIEAIYTDGSVVQIGPNDLLSVKSGHPNGAKNSKTDVGFDASKKFLLLEEGEYSFDYTVNPGKFNRTYYECDEQYSICYDCVVNVQFELRDEDGDVILLTGPQGINDILTYGDVNFNQCNNAVVTVPTFSTGDLEPGTYTITKKLVLNEDSLEKYTANFVENMPCDKTYEFFKGEAEKKYEAEWDCEQEISCAQCRVFNQFSKETIIDDKSNGIDKETDYEDLKEQCKFACASEPKDCAGPYDRMLKDMSPYGQYGKVDVNASGVSAEAYPLSIFRYNNALPSRNENIRKKKKRVNKEIEGTTDDYVYSNQAHWRMPFNKLGTFFYLDENDEVAKVWLEYDATTKKYIPDVFSPNTRVWTDDETGKLYTYPHHLRYLKDFLQKWKPRWAEDLVYYHPEYRYYEFCIEENNYKGIVFDKKFKDAQEFSVALDAGVVSDVSQWPNPVNKNGITLDTFFLNDGNSTRASARAQILADMGDYDEGWSIYQVAAGMVECPDPQPGSCPKDVNICKLPEHQIDIRTNDEYWKKYRDLYLAAKNSIYDQFQTKYAIQNESYNGCIGVENYRGFKDPNIARRYGPYWWSPYFMFDQNGENLCHKSNYVLYQDKIKVFDVGLPLDQKTTEDVEESCETKDDQFYSVQCEGLPVTQEGAEKEMAFLRYEQCGQCPNMVDVQTLLLGLVDDGEFMSSGKELTCPWYPYLQNSLVYELGFFGSLNIVKNPIPSHIIWKNTELTADRAKGEIYTDETIPQKEGIEFKILDYKSGFSISNIEFVCCFEHQNNPQYFVSQTPATVFKFKADIHNGLAGDAREVKTFIVEAYADNLYFVGCQFNKICKLETVGEDFETFLNILVHDYSQADEDMKEWSSKVNDLLNADLVISASDFYKDELGTDFWESIGGTAEEPKTWSSSVSQDGHTLTATLTSGTNSGQIKLKKTSAYGFDKIVEFVAMRIDDSKPMGTAESHFIINAIVSNGQGTNGEGTELIEISGESSDFVFGSCYEPVAKGGKLSSK